MEKIININYQNRNISIEENAYNSFKVYENELKTYFLKEESGEETFADLQNRMAEIFEEILKKGKVAIQQSDIDEMISTIGNPSDFENHEEKMAEPKSETKYTEQKKLYRNKDKSNRIVAGVCSGIANYTSIDPIAVRLIFVLFSFNIGLLVYVILWIILPVQEMKVNVNQKLFRNPKDKILGGICSGIAQFFKIETWIIRAIFVGPIVLSFLSHRHFIFHDNFFGHSLTSLMAITYGILWLITPLAKSSTDFMLLKGEPININSIQNTKIMSNISNDAKSGINIFFKVIAYIIIGLFLLFLIPSSIGILLGSLFSYNVASVVLFTPFIKTIAFISMIGLVAFPLIACIVWIIRKIAGYKSPNKSLRVFFGLLGIIGFLSTLFLVYHLIMEMNTYASVTKSVPIVSTSDTIYVQSMQGDLVSHKNILFEFNNFGNIIEKGSTENTIKAVRVKYKESKDSSFYIEIEQTAFGGNREKADHNCAVFSYNPVIENNTIKLPTTISISNKIPYRLQNVKVTIFVPKGKTLIVRKELKKELSFTFNAGHNGIYFSNKDKENYRDEIINFGTDSQNETTITTITNDDGTIIKQTTTTIDENDIEDKKEALKIAQENLNSIINDNSEKVKEAQDDLIEAQKELEKVSK